MIIDESVLSFSFVPYRSNCDDDYSTTILDSQVSASKSKKRSRPISNPASRNKRSAVVDNDHEESIPTNNTTPRPTAPPNKKRRRY